MSDRVLSQNEIDSVFRNLRDSGRDSDIAKRAVAYDFRRPDRIAKDQLRSIHLLHENFSRGLASSLSAYLRTFVVVNLISVEQLSFAEFSGSLAFPSCIVLLGLRPYEGNAILELSHGLVFPIFEMLLGGTGQGSRNMAREITDIEKSILDSVFRIILQDLRNAWHTVSFIDFAVESHESGPQLLQILAPNEAVVAVSMELRVGDHSGLMNIGIPSIIIKMLRQKFTTQWSARKSQTTESEHGRMLKLIKPSKIGADIRLNGPRMMLEDLLNLDVGDVLTFDHPLGREIELILNGAPKFSGHIVTAGNKRAFQIKQKFQPVE